MLRLSKEEACIRVDLIKADLCWYYHAHSCICPVYYLHPALINKPIPRPTDSAAPCYIMHLFSKVKIQQKSIDSVEIHYCKCTVSKWKLGIQQLTSIYIACLLAHLSFGLFGGIRTTLVTLRFSSTIVLLLLLMTTCLLAFCKEIIGNSKKPGSGTTAASIHPCKVSGSTCCFCGKSVIFVHLLFKASEPLVAFLNFIARH